MEVVHDRKAQILRVASELLLTRSFTSFSYQDLSDRLGIRKASIHHHFPTKDDLLVALTERYRLGQKKRLDEIDAMLLRMRAARTAAVQYPCSSVFIHPPQ